MLCLCMLYCLMWNQCRCSDMLRCSPMLNICNQRSRLPFICAKQCSSNCMFSDFAWWETKAWLMIATSDLGDISQLMIHPLEILDNECFACSLPVCCCICVVWSAHRHAHAIALRIGEWFNFLMMHLIFCSVKFLVIRSSLIWSDKF